MNVIWRGSPNYWAGRTQKISKIVIHHMNGTLAATDRHFATEASQVSAHRGYEDDNRHDYVRDQDTAWHARQANPFALGYELSADLNRAPSDKTYENVIRDAAADCQKYGLNPDTDIVGHNTYVATACPGIVDLKRIREGVKAILAGRVAPAPVVPENKPALPQPVANKSTGGFLRLPASATSWRIYRERGPYTVGNQIGTLNPSLFGGLTYEIFGNPTANVYIIKTRDFGRVAIYAGAETGASVAATNQGITMGAGGGKTVSLPAAPTWRVYKPAGPYTVGHEVGYLAPANYGGLSYAVLSQPAPNVVTIQTQSYGRVAIYVGPGTGAVIK